MKGKDILNRIDTLITNANILTLDDQNSKAGSIAISDGIISNIWRDAEPPINSVNITRKTKIIDLKGQTLLPGFIDTHNHILMYALMRDQIDCSTSPETSIKVILEAIGEKAKSKENGGWILGHSYDDTLFHEQRHPTRFDLDKVAPNNPVLIKHISGHIAVANSLALEMAGIAEDISNPSDGYFGRDPQGKLNGVLFEWGAMNPVTDKIPNKSIEGMLQDIENTANEYISKGITTNTDAGIGIVFGQDELEVHLKAAEKKLNPMRTKLMIMHDYFRDGEVYADYTPQQLNSQLMEQSNNLVQFDSVKFFQDGSIQGLTGALREPYYKYPNEYGSLIHEEVAFQQEISNIHRRGFRITTHGNGDRAIGSIIDAYQSAIESNPRAEHKHRIEHVQTASSEDLDRMKELGIAGSFFINHVYYWGDRHKNIFLGPERASRLNPLAEVVKKDLLFTLHSDCPITAISPLFSIWAAVNRITRNGEVLGPDQKIDVITALKSITLYGADLNFDKNITGSIEVGKHADFAVLEEDPTSVDPMHIKDIEINATIIGGEPVYGI
ncbi:amidohydrolase family protein [Virgibacillus halodenitrificans]|nr:amidohydrolase family protein [Virgibacillus halodenitrificans]